MAPNIFITGSTGYIGGSVLNRLVTEHPEYQYTALLRSVTDDFTKAYPKVNIVKGEYDSADILSKAASEADIVIHNGNSDHETSIKALIDGLLSRSRSTGKPSFLVHLGGTGIVADFQDKPPNYHGKQNPKIWSDIDDIDTIWSLPDGALHRNVDKIIQAAWSEHGDKLKTAIMCPPDIYGEGKGPGRKLSVFMPLFVNEAKKLGTVFSAEEGMNTRSWVHIDDLTTIYLRLAEAAAAGGGDAGWGKEGYYFAATQEHTHKSIAEKVGTIMSAQGVLSTPDIKQLSLDEIMKLVGGNNARMSTYQFASNSRTRSHRAQKLLGYQPSAAGLFDELEAAVTTAEDELHLTHSSIKINN